MQDNFEKAFQWIVDLLNNRSIPFQVVGGLAARCYGSTRPLFDIDIDIPEQSLQDIVPFVKDVVIQGPYRHIDAAFDTPLIIIEYQGCRIDLSGRENERFHNKSTQQWELLDIPLARSVRMEVFHRTVPVITKADLIEYKKKINRPEDQQDVLEII